MIPLVPALFLAFLSFITSAFVILRVVIPILPPHPWSKRVSPAEFGLPTFKSLSSADKSHIWLAALDLIAVSLFIWQITLQATNGPLQTPLAHDPGAAVRLWLSVTIRQTCLLVVASVTLLHVRMAQSVSFGRKHWMLWGPTALLVITSTAIAVILSSAGVDTLFYGLTAYSIVVGVLSTVSFICLIRTLIVIKRNLSYLNDVGDPWPPVRQIEEKPRPTEEIDAIRDGASWITSNPGSRRGSMSAWSFSTHNTVTSPHGQGCPQKLTSSSVPAKSSFWFGSNTPNDIHVPPVPSLPSPYSPISPSFSDRKDAPQLPNHPRVRLDSQSSWLTSSNGSHATFSTWSYPTTTQHEGTVHNASTHDFQTALSHRPISPALADAQVLGGYGYAPGGLEAEKGLAALAASNESTFDISIFPAFGWSVMIWIPLGLALPYLIISQNSQPNTAVQILFLLSMSLSSPLLALNLLLGSPLPIPVGLFDARDSLPTDPNRPLVHGSLPSSKWSHEYKRGTSCSATVVESRRSGDVWISKGDAVDGKGKLGRALGLLNSAPKLSVLPPEDFGEESMPPIPFHNDGDSLPVNIHNTPHSETSAQFGRLRQDSRASSHFSGVDENSAITGQIMFAQRQYSTPAQTINVPLDGHKESVGVNNLIGVTTGTEPIKRPCHLRARSVSSVNVPDTPTGQETFSVSPPPSFPLPPTPPNVRVARLAMLSHKKSFSSGHKFSFKAVDDINQIDAMTAGVLPLLVPGLTVGHDMKIKNGGYFPPGTFSKHKRKAIAKKLSEFGEDFSSPEFHSTPARRRQPRGRKGSAHKKKHFSLPSLGLGKEATSLAIWSSEIRKALENRVGQYTSVPSNVDLGRRNTVLGVETVMDLPTQARAIDVDEEVNTRQSGSLERAMSTRYLGLQADVPHSVDIRSSIGSFTNNRQPPSAASTVTLFEDFEVGLDDSGPQAESTPHKSVSQKPIFRHPTLPMPDLRPTIRYIKSDNTENDPIVYPSTEVSTSPETSSVIASFAQWSSRAVWPLMPQSSKLNRTPSDGKTPLRSLTLLQNRGNVMNIDAIPSSSGIRPLAPLSKETKSRTARQDENSNSTTRVTPRHKNLTSLTLGRSDTSKMRGVLPKTEVFHEVVVRPPSTTEHSGYACSP